MKKTRIVLIVLGGIIVTLVSVVGLFLNVRFGWKCLWKEWDYERSHSKPYGIIAQVPIEKTDELYIWTSVFDSEGRLIPAGKELIIEDGDILDLSKIVQSGDHPNTIRNGISDVYFAESNHIWALVCEQDATDYYWSIVVIDLDMKNTCKVVFRDAFRSCPKQRRNGIYGSETDFCYENRSSYYRNGRIVLSDGEQVVEYCVSDGFVQRFKYNEYTFPKSEVVGSFLDNGNVLIRRGVDEKELTKEKAAEQSEAFRIMLEAEERIKRRPSYHREVPFESIHYVCGEIYVICAVNTVLGGTYHFVYNYDFENDQLYLNKVYEHHSNSVWSKIVPQIRIERSDL